MGEAVISDAAPCARFVLRARVEALPVVKGAFGVLPGVVPHRVVVESDRSALWLGPDEWLLLAPVSAAMDPITDDAASVVDVGHRQVGLCVEGAGAADVLNAGCPLDLRLAAFGVGMCTRTILGKAEIVLWRQGPGRFHVEVARSFAAYVRGALDQALRDL